MIQIVLRQILEGGDSNSFWSDLVVAILGALIGTGTALWVFYLSNAKQLKNENLKKTENQNNKLYYFSSLVHGAMLVLDGQKNNVKKFIYETKLRPFDLPEMGYIPMNDVDRIISKLNLEDYFLSYTSKYGVKLKTVKEYKNIISSFDFLSSNFTALISQLEKAQQFDYQRKIQFKEEYERAYKIIGKILLWNDSTQNPIQNEIIQIYSAFADNPPPTRYDLIGFYQKLIVPYFNLFQNYVANNSDFITSDIIELYTISKGVVILHEYIESNNLRFADDLLGQVRSIARSLKSLQKSSKVILQILDTQL